MPPRRTDKNSIFALNYQINARLRFSSDPDLRLNEFSTRQDVLRVRPLIPRVRGIGVVALEDIDTWLRLGRRSITSRFL